jgi:F0F1-type ATP synthase epsilon subunit
VHREQRAESREQLATVTVDRAEDRAEIQRQRAKQQRAQKEQANIEESKEPRAEERRERAGAAEMLT